MICTGAAAPASGAAKVLSLVRNTQEWCAADNCDVKNESGQVQYSSVATLQLKEGSSKPILYFIALPGNWVEVHAILQSGGGPRGLDFGYTEVRSGSYLKL